VKKSNALRVILIVAVATTGVLGLAGCGAPGEKSSTDTAQSFAVALKAQDTASVCDLAAIGGKPVAGDKDRTSLCTGVLAPKIVAGMKDIAALKSPKITVKEKGGSAKATVSGLSSELTLKKIDGRWLIVIA
jgi:hypothetical protein